MSESLRSRLLWAIAGMAVCGVACAGMWGFTIDDALISIRYARNLLAGNGWRFDAGGPPTDGVTPLPWPLIVLPLAHGEPLAVLDRLRVLGVTVHLASVGFLGWRVGGLGGARSSKIIALVAIALSVPVAAHASSGMETALAMALATCAVCTFERPLGPALFAGGAAALRPEMIPWALALSAGLAIAHRKTRRAIALASVLALAPALVVVIVRVLVFGRPAPLAVLAKPSDLSQGLAYGVAALVACAIPALILAPIALWKEKGPALAIAAAALVHVLAVIAAGGDWMPYARLLAPIAPGLAVAFVLSSPHAKRWSSIVRAALVVLVGGRMWLVAAPLGRNITRDRTALVVRAKEELASSKLIATVDVGWTSAATDAPILDLAGLTDPSIAILPGSHTSKRVDAAMILDRGADALLLYLDHVPEDASRWPDETYTRVVEARLAASPVIEAHFGHPVFLPLGESKGYLLLKKTR